MAVTPARVRVGAAQDLGVRRQADLAPDRVAIGELHEGDLTDVARDRGDGTAEPLAPRSVGRLAPAAVQRSRDATRRVSVRRRRKPSTRTRRPTRGAVQSAACRPALTISVSAVSATRSWRAGRPPSVIRAPRSPSVPHSTRSTRPKTSNCRTACGRMRSARGAAVSNLDVFQHRLRAGGNFQRQRTDRRAGCGIG